MSSTRRTTRFFLSDLFEKKKDRTGLFEISRRFRYKDRSDPTGDREAPQGGNGGLTRRMFFTARPRLGVRMPARGRQPNTSIQDHS